MHTPLGACKAAFGVRGQTAVRVEPKTIRFGVLGFGILVLGFGFWVLGLRFWVLGLGFWVVSFCFLAF